MRSTTAASTRRFRTRSAASRATTRSPRSTRTSSRRSRANRAGTRHFGLSDAQAAENADATVVLEALLFRRYEAKLRYELGFWTRFPDDGGTPEGYEEFLTAATGIRYRRDAYLSDMDSGFYSADYLRAWIRSAQLRRHLIDTIGEDWWQNPSTGELLTELFREGTKPSSEEIASRLGFDPNDTAPLITELTA